MKKVVYCLYFHKSNTKEMRRVLDVAFYIRFKHCVEWMQEHNKHWNVVKFDTKTRAISFIEALHWDEYYEPIVGDSVKFHADGTIKTQKGGYAVYHQKHLFVSDDYTGFDLKASAERTLLLESLPLVKNFKTKIGNLKYWNEVLDYYRLPITM